MEPAFLAANEEASLAAGYTRTKGNNRGLGRDRAETWRHGRPGRRAAGGEFPRTEFRRQTARGGGYQRTYGFVSSKIYDKHDDFDFDIVNFPFLDGDVPRSTSYGVYISQLIRFARVSSHVADFNARNKSLTAKLLQQGYRYHKLRKTFSKFYRRHYELVSKFNVGLKTLLHQGHNI